MPDLTVRAGSRVALGDGAGSPTELVGHLSAAAGEAGGVELILGWCTRPLAALDPAAFASVKAVMGGYHVRPLVDTGRASYVPLRYGTLVAQLHEALRPDVLVAGVVRRGGDFHFGTEVSWQRAAVLSGAQVLAVVRPGAGSDAGPPIPSRQVTVIGTSDSRPGTFSWSEPTDVYRLLGDRIAMLVPEGVRIQLAPGALGTAVADALRRPVHVHTGVLTDAVLSLSRRGLLLGQPLAPYALGSDDLYGWLDGRRCLHGVEVTHAAGRLGEGPPLVAVNTALEMDREGQVNVEGIGGSVTAGIGGHPDFAAAAAALPAGMSILALPTRHAGTSTLVDHLSAPVTTPSHDIDVVVTENGSADLRGMDRATRRRAIAALWA